MLVCFSSYVWTCPDTRVDQLYYQDMENMATAKLVWYGLQRCICLSYFYFKFAPWKYVKIFLDVAKKPKNNMLE